MINLTPPETKKSVKFARMNVTLIQYVILVIIIGVALLAVVVFGAISLEATKDDVNKDIADDKAIAAELEPYHKQAQDLQAQVTLLSSLLGREVKFSELIVEIARVMPPGGVLTGLSLTEDKTAPLSLSAITTDEETAALLRKNLAESDLFAKADINAISTDSNADIYKKQVSIDVTFNLQTENLEQLDVKLEGEPEDNKNQNDDKPTEENDNPGGGE